MEETMIRKYGKEDWEEIRRRFFNSLLVDTSISNLIQNLELSESWPIEGAGEVPAKYIDFNWEEVNELPGIYDHPERLDLLIGALKETIAFDDPFGDMIATVESSTEQDNLLERNLRALGIPADCPLSFSALSEPTLSFCEGEGVTTVGEFASFSERMAQSILVGGDFQGALNALLTKNEYEIARYLPYRPHEQGLHLIEAIGSLVAQLDPKKQCSLLKRYGNKGSAVAAKASLDRKQVAELEEKMEKEVWQRTRYFAAETKEISAKINAGGDLKRCFVLLNDEDLELIGSNLLGRVLKVGSQFDEDSVPAPTPRRGFFARLFMRR